jgi:hypothetical protein
MQVHFDLSEIETFIKDLSAIPALTERENEVAMVKSLAVTHGEIAGLTPVNIGNLRGSELTSIQGEPINLTGNVYTDAIYGWSVEEGRKPGSMPPVEVDGLEYWVRRKLGITDDSARQVAFVIARAIGRRGTKGVMMFDQGLNRATPDIVQIYTNMADSIVVAMSR